MKYYEKLSDDVIKKIMNIGYDCIPYFDFYYLQSCIKKSYHFSEPCIWMWKAFQFGFIYGKRAERARRKKPLNNHRD